MSYVPFQNILSQKKRQMESFSSITDTPEASPRITQKTRHDEQKLITEFIEKIFAGKSSLTYQDYQEINMNVSSEMFIAIMQVLHNTLPCTKNYFRLKTKFLEECQMTQSGEQQIKAIASPTMIRGLGGGFTNTNNAGYSPLLRPNQLTGNCSPTPNLGSQSHLSYHRSPSGVSPEFRVTKKSNPTAIRNNSIFNAAAMQQLQSDGCSSPKKFIISKKM